MRASLVQVGINIKEKEIIKYGNLSIFIIPKII